jgi:hypothetical protein
MRALFTTLALATSCLTAGWLQAAATDIIPETTAERHGLVRSWLAQVQMDRARGRIRDIVLYDGTLFIQTSRAILHAIDAETGQSLWTKQVGNPIHPSLTPGAYRDLLGTVNGSRLYVMNRYNGEVLYEAAVDGVPGSGPAISSKRAYVPMVSGVVMAYRLEPTVDAMKELGKIKTDMTDEEKKAAEEERRQNIRIKQEYIPPLACQSAGRALVRPIVTSQNRDEEYCAWSTDQGYLNIGYIDRRGEDAFRLRYRLLTGQPIASQPAYLPPDPKVTGDSGTIYATSRDGYVYAVLERNGELLWKFSAGSPIVESPVVIKDRVFAAMQMGGLHCLDGKSGKQLWFAPEITQFLAAGKQRVYAADKLGRVQVLDARSGSRLDVLPTEMLPIKVTNSQTDRIYLGSETGLLQCLHEVAQTAPIKYSDFRKPPPEEEFPKPKPKAKPSGEEEPKEKPAPKPRPKATPKPVTKPKPAAKKAKGDDTGLGDDTGDDEKPKKKTTAKKDAKKDNAKDKVKKKVGKKKKGDDDGGDNIFGN